MLLAGTGWPVWTGGENEAPRENGGLDRIRILRQSIRCAVSLAGWPAVAISGVVLIQMITAGAVTVALAFIPILLIGLALLFFGACSGRLPAETASSESAVSASD